MKHLLDIPDLPLLAFRRRGDGLAPMTLEGGKGDSPPPPDYTPVAQASEAAARIGAELGEKQLAEGQRQYDNNMKVAQPVVDAQLEIMRQGIQQGADYFEHSKKFRPVEESLIDEALAGTEQANAAERDAITAQQKADAQMLRDRATAYNDDVAGDIALATGGNQAIYDKYKADIEGDVGRAVADTRVGQTQALNTAMRQAARYGVMVPSDVTALSNQNAAALAAAANNTRTDGTNSMRNVIAGGVGLKTGAFSTGQAALTDAANATTAASMAGRNMRIQDQSLDTAKKLDVAGLARGLPGASAGAYSVATGAGNSAVGNQMAPGQALQGAMAQGANTQMQGQNALVQGKLGVLGAQNSYANAVANSGGDGGLGQVAGAALGAWASTGFAWSDRRLKRDIHRIGTTPGGAGVYRFRYRWSDDVIIGVMADEVPHAAVDMGGFMMVDYRRVH
ncbi:hypothetical protein BN948_01730 [Hydrogenophaga intermedia]|uniref:Peptidase S74 domain-containing protein n=1 Tax=Hydrogenophaga intermedia TaxID=65786 RepID=A0A1L1PCT7_HYDIT|nr:tail fiber domain-containing protein [Hydrogenophaga intermedia]CDN87310.1 hypothetical protein BN948_01730 [Hydrogenophaga intermedia]